MSMEGSQTQSLLIQVLRYAMYDISMVYFESLKGARQLESKALPKLKIREYEPAHLTFVTMISMYTGAM